MQIYQYWVQSFRVKAYKWVQAREVDTRNMAVSQFTMPLFRVFRFSMHVRVVTLAEILDPMKKWEIRLMVWRGYFHLVIPRSSHFWIWELWLLMMTLQAQIRTSLWDTSLLQPADVWDPPSMDLQALLPHCPAIRGSRGFVTFISKPGINVFSVRSLWVYFPLCAFRSYSF